MPPAVRPVQGGGNGTGNSLRAGGHRPYPAPTRDKAAMSLVGDMAAT